MELTGWEGPDSKLGQFVVQQSNACIRVYAEDPKRIEEDANIELSYAEGGYKRSQLLELLQNATDAMREAPGRIAVVLTGNTLYVANQGRPFTHVGMGTVLASHLSRKGEDDIGQFGLGFKSVLAVTDAPMIFSRTGSFAFDRDWARTQMQEHGLESERYPVLRMARPIDPKQAAGEDRTLAHLMGWAATVIRIPVQKGRRELAASLKAFPAPFMLFANQVSELRLEDTEASETRTFRRSVDRDKHVLWDNEDRSVWVIGRRIHTLSASARRDAGDLIRRRNVELAWAAPIEGRGRITLGEFWAHFPTGLRTTLVGILNAPWKLSADRLSMLDGDYNKELLVGVLPGLVRETLPALMLPEDPGSILDPLPARGREARSWGDEIINEPLMRLIANSDCLPDRTGRLRHPTKIILQPKDLQKDWVKEWSPQDPTRWVHESVDSLAERRAKAERLSGMVGGGSATLTSWLEAAVSRGRPDAPSSAAAIRLAARVVRDDPSRAVEVRRAKILLLEDGTLAEPRQGRVFLRDSDSSSGHDFLHAALVHEAGVVDALAVLGIEVLDKAGELRAGLQSRPHQHQWREIWALIDHVNPETTLAVLQEELGPDLVERVHARSKSGRWQPLSKMFLAGDVIPADGRRDADFLIDPSYHARHTDLLTRCGAVSSPRLVRESSEPWVRSYEALRSEAYRNRFKSGPQPSPDTIVVRGPEVAWPLEAMAHLTTQGRTALTSAVLRLGAPSNWTVMSRSRQKFPPREYANPVVYRINELGVLPTTAGPAMVKLCLHPDSPLPDAFPKADVSSRWAELLQLPHDVSGWDPEYWNAFIPFAEHQRPEQIAIVYVHAARAGHGRPDQLLALVGPQQVAKRKADTIAVTSNEEVMRSLLLAKIPALLVAEDDLTPLTESWKLADGRDMLKEQIVAVPDSDPVLLLDKFPPLRLYDAEIPDLDSLEVQTCSAIDVLVSTPQGQQSRGTQGHREGSRILVVNGRDAQLLQRVGSILEVRFDIRSILEEMARMASNSRIAEIREQETIPEKLVAAVGDVALREHVPSTAISDLEGPGRTALTPAELGELAHAVHGYDVLKELRAELAAAGLNPPNRWSGDREARKFVESLGFPLDYAGFGRSSLSPTLDVEGPVNLPDLHPYQVKVVERIHGLLTQSSENRRGMVTLPTGAGKTRVAVEAVVRLVTQERLTGPVIWIVDTEELCEQAVQAWSYVWRALGRGPMQITRFWGTNDAAEAEPGVFQVVVCTIDKIRNAVGNPKYDWLPHPGLIIIDEAHGAIAPSYTEVLNWLGESKSLRGLDTPLLGLTATAFRGHNETETDRLVKRFGGNKLDAGVFGDEEPYAHLQRQGVLARVRQKALEGIAIHLTEKARQHFQQMRSLSREVEAELGQNKARNRAILESLLDQPEDWTTLLFATSVEHANALAAELSYYDVPARPIHSGTDIALRRRYIEQFRAGDVRVLTNYSVLAQGFDAPRVQAVYVTRPTFSPNVYQQMIGRGLRGPKNGGSDEVLIVNVSDNLVQFGDQLAFHHFDHLWSRG